MGQLGGDMMPAAALPSGGTLAPGSRPYNMALGATSQPNVPPPNLTPAPAPDLGNSSVVADSPSQSAFSSTGPSVPGPSKAHKLLTILQSGLQGALAGRAASEQAVAQSGGHRNGGFGSGFEAGFTLPWQRQQQQLGLQEQQAKIGALKAQSDLVQTPNGPIPGWLAKTVLPANIRAGATTEAADTRAAAQVQSAGIAQKFKAVPGVGLFDTTSRQVVPGTANGITITPEIAQDYQLPQEFVGKPMKVSDLASLERAQNQQTATVTGAEGPALVEKSGPNKGKTTKLGLGSPAVAAAQARPVQVADPNNPGNVTYTTAGNAIKTGAPSPQGAATQAAKTEARSEVPTKIGDQKVAFNTMIQHADLLKAAITALHNGDQQTLSSLKNRLKAEFGVAGPVTAEAIANAYQHEVVSVIAKGHMTDAEVSKSGKVLNVNAQSPEQSLGVLDAYRALAQSKMNMLNNQANSAKSGGKQSANDPLSLRQ